jgi:spore germination protein YaaH
MKRISIFILLFSCLTHLNSSAQTAKRSIMQEQKEFYSKYNFTAENQWDSLDAVLHPGCKHEVLPKERSSCTLTKMVYGWYPYWSGTVYKNLQWNLISRFSYCFYDVDYTTGNASSTNSWSTSVAVDSALANGVKVDLCADLMTTSANFTTFFGNTTAQTTLISNLVTLVKNRGASGVNIDFEGMGSSNKAGFTLFMDSLCTRMHAKIPGSKVSIATYAVDWGPVFDIVSLNQYVDYFVIMGYDYYYGGSSTAGATDPLYDNSYCLTNTLTYYLKQGVTPSKLILGLPYYGYSYPTSSSAIHSTTTGSGSAVLFKTVLANSNGYYSTPIWDSASYTNYYNYQISSAWHQCWIDNYYTMGKRIDMVNQRGIGGIGMWALGYDDGYTGYWNKISDKLSTCATVPCSDTIYDMGGPSLSYFNNENYTYTISPSSATSFSLKFTSFNTEANYDTLKIYDGTNTSSALIGNYHGSTSPGTINSSGSSLTLKWRSDGATIAAGWRAVWNCSTYVDNVPPSTAISVTGNWQTQNFTANFTDTDNAGGSGVEKSYYTVSDYNGSEWHGNATRGFIADNFNSLDTSWKVPASSGTWSVTNGMLYQSDSTVNNTNIYARLNQGLSNRYIYHFKAKMTSLAYSTNQRRFGFHFFSDTASKANRNNSYFIFLRQESSQLEFYRVVNDTYTQTKIVTGVTTNIGQWYDYKVIFDRITGKIDVYRDDMLIGSWTDPTPLATSGNYISFRTGNSKVYFDSLEVYRSRYPSVTVNVGSASSNDIRYQDPNPSTPSGKIRSICNDSTGNLSQIKTQLINVDWTAPLCTTINDGVAADVDTTVSLTTLSANWASSTDPHSGISKYWYAIGTTPGGTNVTNWTDNSLNTTVTKSGLTLTNGQQYYFSVKSVNGAGLADTCYSDGIIVYIVTGVDENAGSYQLKAFPNPSSGIITVSLNVNADETIGLALFDKMGNEIVLEPKIKLQQGDHTFNIDPGKLNLASGIYLLKVFGDKKTSSLSLVILP